MMSIFSNAKTVAFDSLFNFLPINFSWMDTKGYISGCNQRLLNFIGLEDINDILGKNVKDFVSEDVWENTKKVIENGHNIVFEEIHPDKDGNDTYFLSIKSPMKSKEGIVIGVVNISIDITDRKLMEIELEKAREASEVANKAKTAFLSNMRHDLRTPFSGIIGIAELLQLKEDDEEKKIYLKEIIESSNALLNHLNEILECVKIENGVYPVMENEFDIYNVLEEVAQIMKPCADCKNLDFIFTMQKGLPRYLIGDHSRMQRILMNIISNAIKFTQQGYVKIDVNYSYTSKNDVLIEFYVEDRGIGIPDDKKEIIFEKFHRLSSSYNGVYNGNGLGLHLVKQFLSDIGGEYNVLSAVGKGTTFKIVIPYKIPLLTNALNENLQEILSVLAG